MKQISSARVSSVSPHRLQMLAAAGLAVSALLSACGGGGSSEAAVGMGAETDGGSGSVVTSPAPAPAPGTTAPAPAPAPAAPAPAPAPAPDTAPTPAPAPPPSASPTPAPAAPAPAPAPAAPAPAPGAAPTPAPAPAAPAPAPTSTSLPEFEVTKAIIPDNEYDWGRKGVSCPTCNAGKGNSRWAFTDPDGNLWLNDIDPHTGLYLPSNGHGLLIDTNTAPVADFGNGPEWMISAAGSQIVYTRYLDGVPHSTDSAQIAVATQQPDGTWTTKVLANSLGRATPEGTQVESDPDPRVEYIKADKTALYWRKMSEPDVEHEMPINELTGGNSRRWIAGTHKIIFQGHLPTDPTLVDQVFTYDTDTGELEQLTFYQPGVDETGKYGGFMFRAPEFNNEYVFFTMANFRQEIRFYRKLTGADGVARWTLFKTVTGPDALPFFFSPEPFVHNGRSYVFTTVNSSPKFFDHSIPTQLAITGIDPLRSDFRMLTNSTTPYRLRLDPEYFITDEGPFIYYNRLVPAFDEYEDGLPDGIWRVDTGLGPRLP